MSINSGRPQRLAIASRCRASVLGDHRCSQPAGDHCRKIGRARLAAGGKQGGGDPTIPDPQKDHRSALAASITRADIGHGIIRRQSVGRLITPQPDDQSAARGPKRRQPTAEAGDGGKPGSVSRWSAIADRAVDAGDFSLALVGQPALAR